MSFKKCWAAVCSLFLVSVIMANIAGLDPASAQTQSEQPKPPEVGRITVEELKAKIAGNKPVTIIDVRASKEFAPSETLIKGAIHVKTRRLRYRLTLAPLKDIPLDREIVTYCACPSEATSIRAAQVLIAAGFKNVRALKGGWHAWLKANGQVENRLKAI